MRSQAAHTAGAFFPFFFFKRTFCYLLEGASVTVHALLLFLFSMQAPRACMQGQSP